MTKDTLDQKSRDEARARRSGYVFNQMLTKGDIAMTDNRGSKGQTGGPVNQHKRMAEGEKITGMKKGGAVHKDEAEDKKLIKKMVKKEDLKMKKGGVAKKK